MTGTWMRLGLIALALGLAAGCAPRNVIRKVESPPKAPVPQASKFNIPNLTDRSRQIDLAAFEGKVVLLDFWATWCPPCRHEIPMLNRLYGEYKDKGAAIIGLAVDDESPEDLARMVGDLSLAYPAGLAGEEIQRMYGGIRAIPTKFLLDKKGGIRQRYLGVVSEAQLKADLDILLLE